MFADLAMDKLGGNILANGRIKAVLLDGTVILPVSIGRVGIYPSWGSIRHFRGRYESCKEMKERNGKNLER